MTLAQDNAKNIYDMLVVEYGFNSTLAQDMKIVCDALTQPEQSEPVGYLAEFYCLPECASDMEWVESFVRYEPKPDADIRNVQPVFTAPPLRQPEQSEPFSDWPEYNAFAMGCGLEDRCITDRYEAMEYGWSECENRMLEQGPFYTAPPLRELSAYHMTSEQVVIIAKTLCSLHSLACGVDTEDFWKIYGEDFLTYARVIVDDLNNAAARKAP